MGPEQSVEQLTFQEDSPPQESTLQPAQKPDEQFTEEANVTLTKLIRINSKKTAPKVTEIANETSEVPEPSDDHLPDREDSSPQETDMELVQKPDDYFIEKSQVKLTNLVRKKSKKIAQGVTKIVDETSKVPEITVEQLAIQEDSSSQNTNVQSIENPDEQFTEEAKVTVTKLSKKNPKKPATEVTDIMDETSEVPEPTVDQLPDREDSSPQETILQLAQKPNEQFTEETQTTVIKITKKKSKKTVPEITEIMGQINEVPEQSVEQLTFQEDSPPQESTLQPAQKPDEQFTEEANVTLTKLIRINSKKTAPGVTKIVDETSKVPEITV